MLLGTVFGLNPPLFLPLFMLYNVLPALASPLFEASRTSLPLLIVCSRLLPSLDDIIVSSMISCWNIVLCLEREMTVGQCLWLYLLFSFTFLFATGFICKPHDETKAYIPLVELPPPLPGSGQRRKRRKQNIRQYYLMRRARSRPVWRPKRDPIRRWTDPTTWRWRHRIPTDGWTRRSAPNVYRQWYCSHSHHKCTSELCPSQNCKKSVQ
jgi:hypothetical protein